MKEFKYNIYIMVGLPGSGKSTIRNDYVSENTVILSTDDYIEKMAKNEGKVYGDVFQKYIGESTKRMKQAFKNAISEGKDIISDQTNLTSKKRKSLLSQVSSDYKKIAIFVNTDYNEIIKRLEKRENETGKSIPVSVLNSMKDKLTAPTFSEGFDEIIIK